MSALTMMPMYRLPASWHTAFVSVRLLHLAVRAALFDLGAVQIKAMQLGKLCEVHRLRRLGGEIRKTCSR